MILLSWCGCRRACCAVADVDVVRGCDACGVGVPRVGGCASAAHRCGSRRVVFGRDVSVEWVAATT